MISFNFSGKVALVTGSSRGIGAGVLSAFARAGATCVLHYWADPDGANQAEMAKLRDRVQVLERLVTDGRTGLIDELVSKRGSTFSAYLVLSKDKKKAEFEFPPR